MDKIIQRLREGDGQAFEELFGAFFAAGRRFVKSFLPEGAAADDIVQDVFLQIWDKRRMFESERHFKSYFYKALRNNTIKQLTRRKPTQELSDAGSIQSEGVFIRIIEVEFNREIARAVSLLPEKRREVILHAMSGMSVEEIAGKLGISINTVKVQKRKAYAALREELKDINTRILSIFM